MSKKISKNYISSKEHPNIVHKFKHNTPQKIMRIFRQILLNHKCQQTFIYFALDSKQLKSIFGQPEKWLKYIESLPNHYIFRTIAMEIQSKFDIKIFNIEIKLSIFQPICWQNLKSLNLSSCNIDNIEGLAHSNFPQLQEIDLNENYIVNFKSLAKANFSKLKQLNIVHPQFKMNFRSNYFSRMRCDYLKRIRLGQYLSSLINVYDLLVKMEKLTKFVKDKKQKWEIINYQLVFQKSKEKNTKKIENDNQAQNSKKVQNDNKVKNDNNMKRRKSKGKFQNQKPINKIQLEVDY